MKAPSEILLAEKMAHHAFTAQGGAMVSRVLQSELAAQTVQ
jgi:hypothetical protein